MYGVFRAVDTISAVTTAKTLIYMTIPTGCVVEILSARITAQDEDTSEQIFAELNRIAAVPNDPSGTVIVPKPTEVGSSSYDGTVKSNITSNEPTYDDEGDAIFSGGANKLAGWEYVPMPEERPIVSPGKRLGLRLIDAISISTDLTAEIVFRKIGGGQ